MPEAPRTQSPPDCRRGGDSGQIFAYLRRETTGPAAAFRPMSTTLRETSAATPPSRGLAAALDWATASHLRALALLLGFALMAFLPGFFQIPPVDRDEARFA